VTIEDDALRAVLYPSLGGRLISLYDKTDRRELLFDNPVFQPANLAIRNAWFSGGVEWNGPLYGHSLLTCSPVFVGRVDTPRGPIVRVYDSDRALETTWQVDLFLSQADRACGRTSERSTPTPATSASMVDQHRRTADARYAGPCAFGLRDLARRRGNTPLAFPVFDGFDGSYPARYPYSKSFFSASPDVRGRGPPAWTARGSDSATSPRRHSAGANSSPGDRAAAGSAGWTISPSRAAGTISKFKAA
jgi:hypothetical protein